MDEVVAVPTTNVAAGAEGADAGAVDAAATDQHVDRVAAHRTIAG